MEWLVTDQYGLFAMGTRLGTRTRKYHGFLCGIAGRLERNLLAHLDLSCHGIGLWTHAYNSPENPTYHPNSASHLTSFEASPWPTWRWRLAQGDITASLTALNAGGFEFKLSWSGDSPAPLVVTPLWAMRALHALNGARTSSRIENNRAHFWGATKRDEVWITSNQSFRWKSRDDWYREVVYTDEALRGYDAREDLHCCGQFEFMLDRAHPLRLQLNALSNHSPRHLFDETKAPLQRHALDAKAQALADFVLHEPPGVVAGFPWFGEWGRDTFIALPGLVAGLHEYDPKIVSWAVDVLSRWATWIESDGMIPNLITLEGPQWESADATLWWTHALASLWALGLAKPELGLAQVLPEKFARSLHNVIQSISGDRHLHLKHTSNDLLSVTTSHSTWMDAQIEGCAASPRLGILPEINALWFQARTLHDLWIDKKNAQIHQQATQLLEKPIEADRPNFVFFYSLPLAPVMFAPLKRALERDAKRLSKFFAIPTGLRTLSPESTDYRAKYTGGAVERDRCYHQGPAWGWLKGHYDMATRRFKRYGLNFERTNQELPTLSSLPAHWAELFDAEPPYQWRGAPAQAWSLACQSEAQAQERWKIDDHLIGFAQNKGGFL